jgi:hypothetical protein
MGYSVLVKLIKEYDFLILKESFILLNFEKIVSIFNI